MRRMHLEQPFGARLVPVQVGRSTADMHRHQYVLVAMQRVDVLDMWQVGREVGLIRHVTVTTAAQFRRIAGKIDIAISSHGSCPGPFIAEQRDKAAIHMQAPVVTSWDSSHSGFEIRKQLP